MLYALSNYFYDRRRGLQKAAGFIGGAYLLGQYALERLEDVRSQVTQDRMAKETLRKRFEQNQQDISFTVMALLPTLGKHILEDMDVEGVTYELQSMSKPRKAPGSSSPHPQKSDRSLTSSIETPISVPDGLFENGFMSIISSVHEKSPSSKTSESSMDWVDQPSMEASQLSTGSMSILSEGQSDLNEASPSPNPDGDLSDSVLSTTTTSSAAQNGSQSSPPESITSDTMSSVTRSKADLWKEVKILTFTRTLTVAYSITLLSVFTHIQLSLLGRSKYVQSIKQMERDERAREQSRYQTQDFSVFWNSSDSVECNFTEEVEDVDDLSEETERKYLTLSWWILHVGWKDVGERVRRGVEEVFEGVSLKTKFTIGDLFRLVSDVRRRVEYEVTFEGVERRINFMSALLPPTPETLQHVLTQGGIPSHVANSADIKFQALLSETRTHILSASCQHVLEVCLDEATQVLFSGLQKHIFRNPSAQNGTDEADPEVRERLAAMLPGLARWCHLALDALPNELVEGLASVRDMEAFSAIVFSSYEDRFP